MKAAFPDARRVSALANHRRNALFRRVAQDAFADRHRLSAREKPAFAVVVVTRAVLGVVDPLPRARHDAMSVACE
ncbi:hypothetical protein [Bradyrhizobium betae]|uniref:Uncharacterized protein n=1 Tax=Bradyrhizobium betae TaxID=244734 RepID=A0A5P6PFG6_9BRAD|nr:hypothetical protein [Bradyrhizobium betae]MCS3730567.1 hypothetical protein [Bradyrhizobium betae]QFI76093.1 hypothetical protein F8237_29055 [Bradyrhizobium betae]